MRNVGQATTMRVAFMNTRGDPQSPLGRVIVHKLRAGVGIRYARRPVK